MSAWHWRRIAVAVSNIPIGVFIGTMMFSIIPMWFGLFGTLITLPLLLSLPRLRGWVVVPAYWAWFLAMLFVVGATGQTWLIEPFRDLDYWRM